MEVAILIVGIFILLVLVTGLNSISRLLAEIHQDINKIKSQTDKLGTFNYK